MREHFTFWRRKIHGVTASCAVALAACVSHAEMKAEPPVKSATDKTGLANWPAQVSGPFVCMNITPVGVANLSSSQPFSAYQVERYRVAPLYCSVWTNVDERASKQLTFYIARTPSPLYAYGLYESLPGGIDQTALRGGPSKRVGGSVFVMKGRWVAWTQPVSGDARPHTVDYESPFAALCACLPGKWSAPACVSTLYKMAPPPRKIVFVPDHFMGLDIFDPTVVVLFPGRHGEVKMFKTIPGTLTRGRAQLEEYRAWLDRRGVTGIYVKNEGTESLYVSDKKVGPLYLTVGSSGLRGVKGMASISEARTLIARWADTEN